MFPKSEIRNLFCGRIKVFGRITNNSASRSSKHHVPVFSLPSNAFDHCTTKLFLLSQELLDARAGRNSHILELYRWSKSTVKKDHQVVPKDSLWQHCDSSWESKWWEATWAAGLHTEDPPRCAAVRGTGWGRYIYDLMLCQDKAPTMANGRRPVPLSNSFPTISNRILPASTKLLSTTWRNDVTSRTQREELLLWRTGWSCYVKAQTPNLTAAAFFPFSFLISNASVERMVFLMTDQRKHCSEELLQSHIQSQNTVVKNSTAMHWSRRLIGSCALRHLTYDQHCLRYKLEYCRHRAMVETGTCSDVHGWGGTDRVRFTNVSIQKGSVITASTLTAGYVSSNFSILHNDTWMVHVWPRKLDFQRQCNVILQDKLIQNSRK